MLTVFLVNTSAFWTALTSTVSVNFNHFTVIEVSLVSQFLFKVVERPGAMLISVFTLAVINGIKGYVS